MKLFISGIVSIFICLGFTTTLSFAQPNPHSSNVPAGAAIPKEPKLVAADAVRNPPPFAFNMSELMFGSQGVGVQSCMYITITNLTNSTQTMTSLGTGDEVSYTIPSPSHQMFPMKIQPHSPVTISVCFKPAKVREYRTILTIRTLTDSVTIPVSGKGIKPEDVGKLPKTDLTIIKPKKKGKEWNFKLQIIASSKVTLQLYDELGMIQSTFLSAALKNEGVYEIPFDGLDKGKKPLPAGKYFLRAVIEDIGHGGTITKMTKTIDLK